MQVAIWAILSACLSMALYAKLSPQAKIITIKDQQKAARRALLQHDGSWDELQKLIATDLSLSLKHVGLISLPFVIACAPVLYVFSVLAERHAEAITGFGPDWTHGFEFWYIAIALVASLALKIFFRIA